MESYDVAFTIINFQNTREDKIKSRKDSRKSDRSLNARTRAGTRAHTHTCPHLGYPESLGEELLLSQKWLFWSSCCGSVVTNLTGIHEDMGLIPGLFQWVKDLVLP